MRDEIITERTRIVPFVAEDIPAIIEMFHEPDSNKFIEPLLNQTDEFYLERLSKNVAENELQPLYWTIFDKATEDFIGTMNLNKFELTNQDQIGIHLGKKYWNKGYGKECCTALLDYAKNVLQMSEVFWIYEEGHEVSKRLAENLGFRPFNEIMDGDCQLNIYRKFLGGNN